MYSYKYTKFSAADFLGIGSGEFCLRYEENRELLDVLWGPAVVQGAIKQYFLLLLPPYIVRFCRYRTDGFDESPVLLPKKRRKKFEIYFLQKWGNERKRDKNFCRQFFTLNYFIFCLFDFEHRLAASVTRSGYFLDCGQLFKAFGNN